MAKKRITQADMAEKLGMTQSAIARRLNGRVSFKVNELAAVAAVLEVPVAKLVEAVS